MMSPIEAIGFHKTVMDTFNISEFVSNWERLRETSLQGKEAMNLFIKDVRNMVWDRLPLGIRLEICEKEIAKMDKEVSLCTE